MKKYDKKENEIYCPECEKIIKKKNAIYHYSNNIYYCGEFICHHCGLQNFKKNKK